MKFNTKTVNVSDIKIDESFRQTAPHADKIATCYGFYCEHLFFDRAIIVNENMLLLDGYVAYLVVKMLDVESVKVVMISGTKEDKAEMIKRPEPAIEPTPEPIKLYCVKDYGCSVTRGKVYDFMPKIIFDSGYVDDNHVTIEDFFRVHPQYVGVLVPLVRRPAKVGEWVYITGTGNAWDGIIGKVLNTGNNGYLRIQHKAVWFDMGDGNEITITSSGDKFFVLDGFTGE